MLVLILSLFFYCNLGFAVSEDESVALEDSKQVFSDFNASAQQLFAQDFDSLAHYNGKKYDIEEKLGNYCSSLAEFPSVNNKCDSFSRGLMEKLNQRSEELKKTLKTDSLLLQNDRLQSLEDQIQGLLFPQDFDKGTVTPKSNLIAALKPIQEMKELCQASRYENFKYFCQLKWKNVKRNLDFLEKKLAEGPPKPEPARVFKDVNPRLRCFFSLPETVDTKPKYHLSDPTGRYRYADMKKTSLGDYALDIPEDRIFQTGGTNTFQINKEFKDAITGNSYGAYITSIQGCSVGPKSNCFVKGISINLSFDDGKGIKISSSGSFNLNRDKGFDATLIVGKETSEEEFRVSCAIASKMRTGEWIFSDSTFVNP